MTDIGLETIAKRCRKCNWCAKYDNYNIMANSHKPVFYCQFRGGIDGKATMPPTLDEQCPYFGEPYEDEEED